MLNALLARWRQGFRTQAFPRQEPLLPDRFRGLPAWTGGVCPADCSACQTSCPTAALRREEGTIVVDLGRCLFCGECQTACPEGCLRLTPEYRMAVSRREDLLWRGKPLRLAAAMAGELRRRFGRSLRLRQVSAGGCNACEADLNVLQTLAFDLSRFGIQFVASPRHADALLVTGPVTDAMREPLLKTYAALPEPRWVIASGACAVSGGPYRGHPEAHDGLDGLLPVDLYIPGCPPHPWTVLDGLLRLTGQRRDRGGTQGSRNREP